MTNKLIKSKKKKYCLIILLLIPFSMPSMIILWNIYVHYVQKSVIERHKIFDSSEFNGHLTKIDISSGFVYFKLNNSNIEYQFKPFSDKFNNYSIFSRFASFGDSIYKKTYGDTLYLIKGKEIYKYTFQNITEDTYK